MQIFEGRDWRGPGGPADLIAMYHTEGSILLKLPREIFCLFMFKNNFYLFRKQMQGCSFDLQNDFP